MEKIVTVTHREGVDDVKTYQERLLRLVTEGYQYIGSTVTKPEKGQQKQIQIIFQKTS